MKVLITTVPFGEINTKPISLLSEAKIDYQINPLGRKLTEDELAEIIEDFDAVIAGTEPITAKVLNRAKKLKLISRVGVGLDSVDLTHAKKLGIQVSYTPEAPAPAVAELSIGLMISLLRSIHISNDHLKEGHWKRHFGRRLSECTIGLIGLGRIGQKVLKHLEGFHGCKILLHDLIENSNLITNSNIKWASLTDILKTADVISLHVPLNSKTKDLIGSQEMAMMKSTSMLVNTARGGIINEQDLYDALKNNKIAGAAIDVFEVEPYKGNLATLENCLLTAHMGSMSIDCRSQMEIEATEEVLRFVKGKKLCGIVPEAEYNNSIKK